MLKFGTWFHVAYSWGIGEDDVSSHPRFLLGGHSFLLGHIGALLSCLGLRLL